MKISRTALRAAAGLSTLLAISLVFSGAALATHTGPLVEPTQEAFPGGDPICPAGTTGIRWSDTENGDTKDGVTVSWNEDGEVSFQTSGGVLVAEAVIKGGTDQNVYDYSGQPGGGVDHDNGLVAPDNTSGDNAGVSHVDLCVFTPEATEPPTLPPTGPTDPPTLPPTDASPFEGGPTSGGSLIWLMAMIALAAAGLTTYAFVTRAKATARR